MFESLDQMKLAVEAVSHPSCPVIALAEYSNYVVSALPHLKVLDQQEITADLRANAAKWKNSQATVNTFISNYYVI